MRSALLVAALTAGCALQDFDRYSARFGEDGSVTETRAEEDSGFDTAQDPLDTTGEMTDTTIDALPIDTGPPPPTCPAGQLECGGGCIDVTSDREHCGACTSCEQQGFKGSTTCVAGKCQCRPGATKCGDTCTYVDSDPLHCKACNTKIKDATLVCGSGCVSPLRECKTWGYGTTCPVTCVDTASEGNHCYTYSGGSTSFVRCWGSNAGACISGKCTKDPCTGVGRRDCTAPFGPSVDTTVRSCVDTLNDPNHCGGCNVRCSVGEVCAAGLCRAYRPARSTADCTASEEHITPSGWTFSVCARKP